MQWIPERYVESDGSRTPLIPVGGGGGGGGGREDEILSGDAELLPITDEGTLEETRFSTADDINGTGTGCAAPGFYGNIWVWPQPLHDGFTFKSFPSTSFDDELDFVVFQVWLCDAVLYYGEASSTGSYFSLSPYSALVVLNHIAATVGWIAVVSAEDRWCWNMPL